MIDKPFMTFDKINVKVIFRHWGHPFLDQKIFFYVILE